jgi:hypothetical protein
MTDLQAHRHNEPFLLTQRHRPWPCRRGARSRPRPGRSRPTGRPRVCRRRVKPGPCPNGGRVSAAAESLGMVQLGFWIVTVSLSATDVGGSPREAGRAPTRVAHRQSGLHPSAFPQLRRSADTVSRTWPCQPDLAHFKTSQWGQVELTHPRTRADGGGRRWIGLNCHPERHSHPLLCSWRSSNEATNLTGTGFRPNSKWSGATATFSPVHWCSHRDVAVSRGLDRDEMSLATSMGPV